MKYDLDKIRFRAEELYAERKGDYNSPTRRLPSDQIHALLEALVEALNEGAADDRN